MRPLRNAFKNDIIIPTHFDSKRAKNSKEKHFILGMVAPCHLVCSSMSNPRNNHVKPEKTWQKNTGCLQIYFTLKYITC